MKQLPLYVPVFNDLFLFQVHRLVIVDAEDRVSGVVSLSDILTYLVLRLEGKQGEFFLILGTTLYIL